MYVTPHNIVVFNFHGCSLILQQLSNPSNASLICSKIAYDAAMDPLSIASASGSVALVCIRLSKQIYTWVNQTKDVDEEVEYFATEVVAYSRF